MPDMAFQWARAAMRMRVTGLSQRAAVTGIVLAGGRSRRLGSDKRLLRLWGAAGPTLLERAVATLAPLCSEVVVVLNDPEGWPTLPARLVRDHYADAGPLGGIFTGLQHCRTPFALLVAADMPLLKPELLEAMLRRPRSFDALVPRSPDPGATRNSAGLEPLLAIYSRACLPTFAQALEGGERQVSAALAPLDVAIVEGDEIRRHDPEGHSFRNINTPEQLAEVALIIAGSGGSAAV